MTVAILAAVALALALVGREAIKATRQAQQRAAHNRKALAMHERATAMLRHFKPEGMLARRARRRAFKRRQRWEQQQQEWTAGERRWN
jgi:outer membrane biogenesis lipoprotein LolB